MSGATARVSRSVEATLRRVRFAEEDLTALFDQRMLKRGRGLELASAVSLTMTTPGIAAIVADGGAGYRVQLSPTQRGRQILVSGKCSCGAAVCTHQAATALAVLDREPGWRRPVQPSLFEIVPDSLLLARPQRRVLFEIEPGGGDHALYVAVYIESVERGVSSFEQCTPAAGLVIADDAEAVLCRILGGSDQHRVGVTARQKALVDLAIKQALLSRGARWKSSGRRLVTGPARRITASRSPQTGTLTVPGLSRGSAVIEGNTTWYVDAATGCVGTADLWVSEARQHEPGSPDHDRSRATTPPRRATGDVAPAIIVDGKPSPVLTLFKADRPGGAAGREAIDVARISFAYGDALIDPEDERQFARGSEGAIFFRRDRARESAHLERLQRSGFAMMRAAAAGGERGARVFTFPGQNTAERWQAFVAGDLRMLEAEGWQIQLGADFGTRLVTAEDGWLAEVVDTGDGWFSLAMDIEIEGERVPLLPILTRLIAEGVDAARVVDGRIHAALDGGRIVALPADRVARLIAIVAEMSEAGRLTEAGTMALPAAEAASLLDLDDVAVTQWENAAAIRAYASLLRSDGELPRVTPPPSFTAELRPYQQYGLDWLQHLRANAMAGILADDMGLGKTAQTLAHIAVEDASGRLDRPVLIVVPTSLVANWVSEAAKFVPALRLVVLHGLDRHQRRTEVYSAQLVVTTYTVLARDVEAMRNIDWHLVVLDEAQAVKNPDTNVSRAVRQLRARHRLCLSGTPVENNLGEIWSQFAFLMPGLLGDRRRFAKRFRIPIERDGDIARRASLARRLKPFVLRRTKGEVATDLPPKTEIIRRVELEIDQRDLYETIRLSMHEKLNHEIKLRSLEHSRILVLDALLKLRQVCCDPRLVKLAAARAASEATPGTSSKLLVLMNMLRELAGEGRRALVFSQFTSMLDLIKPELDAAGIGFVELTGATGDRAGPVNRFQSGAVPVFLISLKAGGRGLNLTAADTVIHYDPWWNPAVENQATDRAFRIGQDKPVFVYKLIAAGTVEERILELQAKKGRLAATLDPDAVLSVLDGEDLDYLFEADDAGRCAGMRKPSPPH